MGLRTVLKRCYGIPRTNERRRYANEMGILILSHLLINLPNSFSHLVLSPQSLSSVVCKKADGSKQADKIWQEGIFFVAEPLSTLELSLNGQASLLKEQVSFWSHNSCLRAGKSHNQGNLHPISASTPTVTLPHVGGSDYTNSCTHYYLVELQQCHPSPLQGEDYLKNRVVPECDAPWVDKQLTLEAYFGHYVVYQAGFQFKLKSWFWPIKSFMIWHLGLCRSTYSGLNGFNLWDYPLWSTRNQNDAMSRSEKFHYC